MKIVIYPSYIGPRSRILVQQMNQQDSSHSSFGPTHSLYCTSVIMTVYIVPLL